MNQLTSKFIVILFFLLFISGCGHDDDNTTTNTQPITQPEKLVNGFKFTFKTSAKIPLEGVVVQLNNDTVNIKTSGVDGLVTFSNLVDSKYDIHFFMPQGYSWGSVYGVKPGLNEDVIVYKQTEFQDVATSYVKITGQISNITHSLGLDYFAKFQRVSGGQTAISTPTYTGLIATDVAPGTKLVGDLWATEFSFDSTTDILSIRDAVNITGTQLTTVNKNDAATQLDISFNAVKPEIISLLKVNSVLPPTGFTQQVISVTNSIQNSITLYSDFNGSNFPLDVLAADPLNLNEFSLFVSSDLNSTSGSQWNYENKFSKGLSVDIKSQIDGVPQITPGQSGNTIQWSPTTGQKIKFQSITISNPASKSFSGLWNLSVLDSTTAQVVLPKIPPSVTSVLTAGKKYNIQAYVVATDAKILNNKQSKYSGFLSNRQLKFNASTVLPSYHETVLSDIVSWTR